MGPSAGLNLMPALIRLHSTSSFIRLEYLYYFYTVSMLALCLIYDFIRCIIMNIHLMPRNGVLCAITIQSLIVGHCLLMIQDPYPSN